MSQSPRHRVTGRNQTIALRCDPVSGHSGLYWYRQALGQGLEFLTYFQSKEEPDKLELRNDRFSAERPEGSVSHLKIQRVEPQDSAVYLCASSSGYGAQTQYFGPGTRLLVLGEHGQCGWVFVGSARAVLNRGHPDLWGWQPADRGG